MMSHQVGAWTTLLVLLLLLLSGTVVESVPNTNMKDVECNTETWLTGDPYGVNVGYCIRDLVITTPTRAQSGYIFTMESVFRGTSVFGLAKCTNLRLSPQDCFLCLVAIQANFPAWCPYAVGATFSLVDCMIRYERNRF